MKYTFLILICFVTYSCDQYPESAYAPKAKDAFMHPQINRLSNIEIMKIRDCEYVLWKLGHGIALEHYAGCINPNHCN